MAKRILAVLAGILTGFVIVFIGDATTHKMHPPPPGIENMSRETLGEYVTTIPTLILVVMVIFWLLSSFLGAMVAALIARSNWRGVALITGAILMAAALANLAFIPHPTWMLIVAIVGYLPAAYLGGYLVRGRITTA
jgi:hypothetical protein